MSGKPGMRQFPAKFRQRIAHLVLDEGQQVSVVAAEWGVNRTTVQTWVDREKAARNAAAVANGESVGPEPKDLLQFQAKVIEELRGDNEKLQKHNATLRDTMGIIVEYIAQAQKETSD